MKQDDFYIQISTVWTPALIRKINFLKMKCDSKSDWQKSTVETPGPFKLSFKPVHSLIAIVENEN